MRGSFFNPNLPSGRLRLFVALLLLFSVVGFGTRYLLIQSGWVGSSSSPVPPTQEEPPAAEQEEESPEELPPVTEEDREQARHVAEDFVAAYLSYSPDEKEKLLEEVKLTRSLQAEIEPIGPVTVRSTEAAKVEDYQRDQDGEIVWNIWATVAKGKGNFETVYEVVLTREGGNWRVGEVTAIEYPGLDRE
ncbi:hypothetical protein [Desmospora activa]|uniref:Conjugative transposon protein TcpC n=1 Tax=Desmospora activa DSM 45169 TaxID=1121389 RepID=A0A2T4YZ39_9BACL|nr:hypothetical protein [Desmospora activa]PTM52179.1 hypothetical protein C8J48_3726 [Desmospora activa DSM 45169]